MSIHDFFEKLNGRWQGTYRLWLDPAKDSENSAAAAEIGFVANKNYVIFKYAWAQGGNDQEGVFLMGGDKNEVSATWGDSFHSAPMPMICEGKLADNGEKLVLNGHYTWGEEKWGWRTEFHIHDSKSLVMEAYNISPMLEEDIAVRCEMERASK